MATSRLEDRRAAALEKKRDTLDQLVHALAVVVLVMSLVLLASLIAIGMIFAELREVRQVEKLRKIKEYDLLGITTEDPLKEEQPDINITCIRLINEQVKQLNKTANEQDQYIENERKKQQEENNYQILKITEYKTDTTLNKRLKQAMAVVQELTGFNSAVYFTFGLVEDTVVEKGDIVKFNQQLLNIGVTYDVETGKFVGVTGGYYLFEVHVMNTENNEVMLLIKQKDQTKVAMYVKQGQGVNGASNAVVLRVVKGDEVYVEAVQKSTIRGHVLYAPVSTFTGVLLSMA